LHDTKPDSAECCVFHSYAECRYAECRCCFKNSWQCKIFNFEMVQKLLKDNLKVMIKLDTELPNYKALSWLFFVTLKLITGNTNFD
jgi:hypothetical protein